MPIGNAGFGGGRSLGRAVGAIIIDTSSVDKAAVSVRRVSKEIDQSITKGLGKASTAVDTFTQKLRSGIGSVNFTKISKEIKNIQGELLAVGIATGALSAIGIQTAGGIQEARIQLKGMTGSLESAEELMASLRKQANAAGIPFSDMLSASRQLLPTLQGNTEELEKWLPIVRRVAVLNQREGVAGAAFAINEALSSGGTDLVSLAERFNISRVQLRQALEQTGGDFAAALDLVLVKMGITQQTADEMGQSFNASFRAAKDAAAQALGAGFEPLLRVITPILQQTAEWLNKLREVSPQILTVGAGVASIAAVGAPALLFFGQLVTSAQTLLKTMRAIQASGALSQLSGLAPLLGKLGVGVAAIGAGALAGNAIGRGIGRATGNEAIANTTLQDMPRILRQAAVVVADGASKIVVIIASAITQAVEVFVKGVAGMVNAMGSFVRTIAQILPENLGGSQLDKVGENIQGFGQSLSESATTLRKDFLQGLVDGQRDFVRKVADFFGFDVGGGAGTAAGGAGAASGQAGGFSDEQTAAITQFYDQMDDIEENRREQRLEAERQYQEQRGQIIEDYNRTAAREEEDFLRQRTRQNEQFLRDVERIAKERVKREAEWLEELNKSIADAIAESNGRIADLRAEGEERIADMRSEANERILEQEEDYQRQREQRAAEHRNRLLEAAARLDASTIANEQRNFATQEAKTSQEHAIRLEREREGLEKRIAQEQAGIEKRIAQEQAGLEERLANERAAHAERVAEARIADEERIADMREALREQQRIEDEDRRLRLQRTKEDHQRQLQQLRDANTERLAEINRQAAKEKAQLQEQFKQQLVQLGFANAAYLQTQEAHQQRALESFEKYWSDWEQVIEGQSAVSRPSSTQGSSVARPTPNSPSRPVYNLPSGDALNFIRSGISGGASTAAMTGNRGGRTVTTGDIPITIHAAPGMNEGNIAKAVRFELESLFQGMAG